MMAQPEELEGCLHDTLRFAGKSNNSMSTIQEQKNKLTIGMEREGRNSGPKEWSKTQKETQECGEWKTSRIAK